MRSWLPYRRERNWSLSHRRLGQSRCQRWHQCPLLITQSRASKDASAGWVFDVRFTPESDRLLRRGRCPLCAITDQSAPQQKPCLFDHRRP
jgi:hypothetical protein